MIGKLISEYMKANGIKQSYVAEKVGITPSVMSDICIRNRKIDCLLYYRICCVLGVPYEFFIEKTLNNNG